VDLRCYVLYGLVRYYYSLSLYQDSSLHSEHHSEGEDYSNWRYEQ
jgi:hypothetical protein